MSMPVRLICCSGCDFTAQLASVAITLEYTTADGRTAHAHRQHVWCQDCEAVTNGEALPSVDSIAKQLAEHTSEQPGLLSRLFDAPQVKTYQLKLSNLQTLQSIVAGRTSPPRCLKCFGTRAHALMSAKHSCGGVFREGEPDLSTPRFHRRPQTMRLSAEGLPLP